jgi:hypothetical protein
MGFFDRLFGRRGDAERRQPADERLAGDEQPLSDEQAIQRYRYLLRTAPPETIEQAHAEAFAQLTPEQRAQVLRELGAAVSPQERAALGPGQDDPQTLARLATRAEVRQPGTLERTFGGMGWGGGGMMGVGWGGSFLPALAGSLVGTMIAQQFFNSVDPALGWGDYDQGSYDQEVGAEPSYEDSSYEADSSIGGDDFGGDFGGDF